MRFPPHLLDEIRARLPISQIAGAKVKLRRAGREYVGLSPFKTERTPSFTVNDQKGFYHCFASGEHGDIFTFLMKTDGLSFPEAVERLASEANVALPQPAQWDAAADDHLTRIRLALEEACRFFEKQLAEDQGQIARAYLQRRGVNDEAIRQFRLGFAPNARSVLRNHLASAGFSLAEMIDAGVLIHGDDIPVPYDRFRGRLIFPIRDLQNRVIAFGGRALAEDQKPKYLNSPDTPLFQKGHVLFNAAGARKATHDRGGILVAEGYMDVIALAQGGFANAVAPLGTALTAEQLHLLWRMTPEPTLCFDGDSAGRRAAFRAIDTALPHLQPGRSLKFVFLPDGQDPDDLIRNSAPESAASVLSAAIPMIDVIWQRESQAQPLDTPERRAAFEARVKALAAGIAHAGVRYHYMSALKERLREAFPFGGGRYGAQRGKTQQPYSRQRNGNLDGGGHMRTALAPQTRSSAAAREILILLTVLNHPWLLDRFADEFASLHFEHCEHEALCNAMLAAHAEDPALDSDLLETHLVKEGYGKALSQLTGSLTHRADHQLRKDANHDDVVAVWHHITAIQRKAVGLKNELEDAERAFFKEQTDENFQRLRLLREHATHIF